MSVSILQLKVSIISRHLRAKDFCKLMLCLEVCSRGGAGRSSFWLLLKASFFTVLPICTLFCLPLRSSLSVFPTLPVALVTLWKWDFLWMANAWWMFNTIIDFTLIFLMNQEKLLCKAVTAKKYMTSCLKTTAWKQSDRSTSLFSLFWSIFFKHTVYLLISIFHHCTKAMAYYLQQR